MIEEKTFIRTEKTIGGQNYIIYEEGCDHVVGYGWIDTHDMRKIKASICIGMDMEEILDHVFKFCPDCGERLIND